MDVHCADCDTLIDDGPFLRCIDCQRRACDVMRMSHVGYWQSDAELEKLIAQCALTARCAGIFDNGPSAANAAQRGRDELARRKRAWQDYTLIANY